MITALLKVELRKVWAVYTPLLILVLVYMVLAPGPLKRRDTYIALLAVGQGCLLAWLIFRDPGSTAEFLFSRPLLRKRLFLTRWGLGMGLQLLTILAVTFVLSAGLRSGFQERIGSPYYPMVRWLELDVLWSLALLSLVAYQLQVFLQIRESVVSNQISPWLSRVMQLLAIAMVTVAIHAMLNQLPFMQQPISVDNSSGGWTQFSRATLLVYVVGAVVLGTLACMRYYGDMEVDAQNRE